jgi:hypothetical protein
MTTAKHHKEDRLRDQEALALLSAVEQAVLARIQKQTSSRHPKRLLRFQKNPPLFFFPPVW